MLSLGVLDLGTLIASTLSSGLAPHDSQRKYRCYEHEKGDSRNVAHGKLFLSKASYPRSARQRRMHLLNVSLRSLKVHLGELTEEVSTRMDRIRPARTMIHRKDASHGVEQPLFERRR
jgi:hypothetical protein